MGTGDVSEGAEVVYLLAELRSDRGPVHEIGTRAQVIEADGDRLTLSVGYGRFESVVSCSRAQVATQRRSFSTRRTLRADRWSPA